MPNAGEIFRRHFSVALQYVSHRIELSSQSARSQLYQRHPRRAYTNANITVSRLCQQINRRMNMLTPNDASWSYRRRKINRRWGAALILPVTRRLSSLRQFARLQRNREMGKSSCFASFSALFISLSLSLSLPASSTPDTKTGLSNERDSMAFDGIALEDHLFQPSVHAFSHQRTHREASSVFVQASAKNIDANRRSTELLP